MSFPVGTKVRILSDARRHNFYGSKAGKVFYVVGGLINDTYKLSTRTDALPHEQFVVYTRDITSV